MMPTLSASKLRQRVGRWFAQGPTAGQCHSCGLSLGPSSSPESLQKRGSGVENERGRWEREEGQEEGSGQWESASGWSCPPLPLGVPSPSVLVMTVSPSGREKKEKVVGDILKEEPKVVKSLAVI